MKFRTEVDIKESQKKIEVEDRIFSIGSCFASEMSDLFQQGQLQTINNPFGTIFNPFSINNAVKRLHDAEFYYEEELITFNDEFISLDHHSSFDTRYVHQTLQKINSGLEEGNSFLQKTNWIIITYGSSFIYEFTPKNKLVANCHKIPQKFFEKRLLTFQEITDSVYNTILNLKDICTDDVQILFTVSPVRHTKDGMIENQLSKSKLITAIHEMIDELDYCHYLPVYEILMDDLRDYRFYKEDMIHPNNQAINYIFEKFGNAYFSDDTKDFIKENFKIHKALEHKTSDEKDPKYIEYKEKLNLRIEAQRKKVKHKIF
ncbi:GSCFA domain-containing protein [Chryseobacterium gambrini]|uniref:GSCFA domain-containing protein n=1 Tax=Chryseobacterium gambrini TaxID=373672 RepID=A0AAJ1R7D5_9FLAO|nr:MULTISPECIES: GSCFA domain-containing protein [Chryseobacterium]MDN4015044.1 GSCFA domain-containing protein [Chryseobacterium gambrini]MDN4031980.1 GSCFA domain-containing protein [Chryseobacterium gambrini]QWA38316.1 GSCFA domain-containing protein [Chryseobacterium sp. ZHDP1]